jgi:hypothetical protein
VLIALTVAVGKAALVSLFKEDIGPKTTQGFACSSEESLIANLEEGSQSNECGSSVWSKQAKHAKHTTWDGRTYIILKVEHDSIFMYTAKAVS